MLPGYPAGVAATSPPYPTPRGAFPWGHPARNSLSPELRMVSPELVHLPLVIEDIDHQQFGLSPIGAIPVTALGRLGTALGRADSQPPAVGRDDHPATGRALSPVELAGTLDSPGFGREPIGNPSNGVDAQAMAALLKELFDLFQRAQDGDQLADFGSQSQGTAIVNAPDQQDRIEPNAIKLSVNPELLCTCDQFRLGISC